MPRSIDIAISFLAVGAVAASCFVYWNELQSRVPVEEAIVEYELDLRRPADVDALRFQPSADLRAAYLSYMSLADVYSAVSFAGMSADERGRWIRSLARLDQQLERARDLNLDALSRRPGWAFHHAYTGELEYAALRRQSLDAAAAGSSRWETPLLNGIELAPGNLFFPSYLGGAYLETWGAASLQQDPRDVLRNAMKSSRFVSRNYFPVTQLLGEDEAIGLLPDDPRVLRTAFARESRSGSVTGAATLMRRIDDAERATRAENLDAIRERKRLGDIWGRGAAVVRWVSTHKPEDLDDQQGRREVAEVLALWPEAKRGTWLRDPRSRLVQYFLSGREDAVDGSVLADAITLLSDIPPPIDARVKALAGQTWEADQMLRSSGTRGSFEWTPVAVDLARVYMLQEKPDRARAAIDSVPSASLGECNVLLVRRELDESDSGVERSLQELTPDVFSAGMFSRTGALSLCVDPRAYGGANLIVDLTSDEPSLVSYGWDGGRVGSRVVEGDTELAVSLSGIEGRHPFSVWTEAGPRVDIRGARIVRPN